MAAAAPSGSAVAMNIDNEAHSAGQKRKQESSEADFLEITPLGAGNEVGRSCHILKFKGKTIMLDCGIHPGISGLNCLPYFDTVNAAEIDLLLISHFHLDHAAALPYYLTKSDFKGRVFMTHPTKSIYRLLLQDYVKVSSTSADEALYTEEDLAKSMSRIECLNYHEVVYHKGIKFWCYNAGHVLGAAMFMIEIAGVKVLYTGDYSRREDRHLKAAEVSEAVLHKPDVLIIEATYGVQTLEPVAVREKRLTDTVKDIVHARKGKCLIPAFALGRAQEVLLMLEEFWERTPALQAVPVYFASALARKCMTVYQTFINMMNDGIQKQAKERNPFKFRYITNLPSMDHFEDNGPCVVMASPGMLQNGLSRELFEAWCGSGANGCVIPGYVVEGTLAHLLKSEPSEVVSLSGLKIPVKMSIHYISFSAHADYAETSDFIDQMRPPHVILVHGEANEMNRLRMALERKFVDKSVQVSWPKNCQKVQIEFRPQKIAKLVGRLAADPPADGKPVAGLLVRKDFAYQVLAVEDLRQYSNVVSASILQRLTVPYSHSYATALFFLAQMFEFTTELPESSAQPEDMAADAAVDQSAASAKGKKQKEEDFDRLGPDVVVHDTVTVSVRRKRKRPVESDMEVDSAGATVDTSAYADHVHLEWKSSAVGDMIADAVAALLLNAEQTPTWGMVKAFGVSHDHDHTHGGHSHSHDHVDADVGEARAKEERKSDDESVSKSTKEPLANVDLSTRTASAWKLLLQHLQTMFGTVSQAEDELHIVVKLDDHTALVDLQTLAVSSTNEPFRKLVATAVTNFHHAVLPVPPPSRMAPADVKLPIVV